MRCRLPIWTYSAFAVALIAAAPVAAQETEFERRAEALTRQPIKDVGLLREEAPALLKEAQKAPYSLKGLQSCAQLNKAIADLTAILGPDIDTVDETGAPLSMRLADEAAKGAVGALIPFRGLVREVSGAAGNDRKLRAASTTGIARRAYLKGVRTSRGCPG
jgi:hypothetical protein